MQYHLPTASICIYGISLDPELITKILGLIPSRSHRIGQTFTSPSGRIRTTKTGAWILYAEEMLSPHEIADSVESLLKNVTYIGSIRDILNVDDAQIALALRVGQQPDAGTLSAATLVRIGQLGLSMNFETYQDPA